MILTAWFPDEGKMMLHYLNVKKRHLIFPRILSIERLSNIEDLGFLRFIGRDTTVFLTRLPLLEVIFDENFSYLESDIATNSHWIWNSSNHQKSTDDHEVKIAIILRSPFSRSMHLSFALKDYNLNDLSFRLTDEQTCAVQLLDTDSRRYTIRLNPGVNLFKIGFSPKEPKIAPGGRAIEFGIHNLTLKNLPSKNGMFNFLTARQLGIERNLRHNLHAAGYELVMIRSLLQKFETRALNVEGIPYDYSSLSLKHVLSKRLALVVAKSEIK